MKKLFILFFALFLFDTTIAQTNVYLQKGDQQLSLGQAISRLQLSNIYFYQDNQMLLIRDPLDSLLVWMVFHHFQTNNLQK